MIIYLTNDLCVYFLRDNIFCKGSVDTTISAVDTMVQSKGRNVKKRSSSVDTSPGQVDTRKPSQKVCCSDSQSRSTPNASRSTLDGSPRRPIFQMAKAGRHEMRSGRHWRAFPERLFCCLGHEVDTESSQVDTTWDQVDTEPSQVDTRDLSQGLVLPVWDSVSTHPLGRSTHSGISVT